MYGLYCRTSSQPGLLRRQDSSESGAPTRDVADNIIDLQAQYGIDGFGGGNATDGQLEDGDWTTTTPANWSRVVLSYPSTPAGLSRSR